MVSAVYRGDEAKPSVQTCTCVHRTCNGYGVTGDRYGVGQSHPRCDPCYTLCTGRGYCQAYLHPYLPVPVPVTLGVWPDPCLSLEVSRMANAMEDIASLLRAKWS